MKRRFGFTLIELVIVIVILGILAAFGLPKFVNFKTRAIERSEDAIIGALNTAIKLKFTENIAAGSEPSNAWPNNVSIFTLLEPPPPYRNVTNGEMIYPDGVTWRNKGTGTCYIYCPHYQGDYQGNSHTKGRFYIYTQSILTGHRNKLATCGYTLIKATLTTKPLPA